MERQREIGLWGVLAALAQGLTSQRPILWKWLKSAAATVPCEADTATVPRETDAARLPNDGKTFQKRSLVDLLSEKSRFSSYKPESKAGIQAHMLRLSNGGEYVILKNSELHRYLRLTTEEYYLFTQMDGKKTVQDLVVAYFMKFHILAHERVTGLIRELERESFLLNRPLHLYDLLKEKLSGRNLSSLAEKARNLFFNYQLSLNGLDRVITSLYRSFFFLFFVQPAPVLYPFLSIAGVICFLMTFRSGSYHIFETANSYTLGAITLFLIGIFRISIHEGAHAFATKWCGREIHRGGFLFYMGIPSFFADTSDMWLGTRRERILVSWAGPYSEIILSSILSIVIWAFPSLPLSSLFFKIAFVGYMSAFLNLNPLLELDGYFMLMDWLEIPNLRKRSLHFIKSSLLAKLKKRAALTHEERIFTLFGILCIAWTAVAIALSLIMLHLRMLNTIQDMFNSDSIVARILSSLAFILFVLPLVVSALAMLYLAGRRIFVFIIKWPLLGDIRVTATLTLLCTIIVSVAGSQPAQTLTVSWLLSIILSTASACVIILTMKDLSGSSLTDEMVMKAVFSFFLIVSAALGAFISPEPFLLQQNLIWGGVTALFCASLAFFVYAYRFFLNFEFSLYTPYERFSVGAFLPLSVTTVAALGSFFINGGDGSPVISFLFMSALGIGILSLVLLIPLIGNYSVTLFFVSFLFEGASIISLLLYYFLIACHFSNGEAPLSMVPHPGLFSLSLFLGSVIIFRYLYRRRDFIRPLDAETTHIGDREKLFQAFKVIMDSLLANFRNTFGERRTMKAVRDFNSHAAAQGWNVVLRGNEIQATTPFSTIIEMQHPLASAFDYLRSLLIEMTGKPLMEEYLTRVYDLLYWEEREVANLYLFVHLPWSSSFVRSPEFKEDAVSFLSDNPLFFDLEKDEVASLLPILQLKRYMPGQVIVRQDEPGNEFFMIRQGRARVFAKNEKGILLPLADLRRGDFFGEKALLGNNVRTATVKALTELEALMVSRVDFDRHIKEHLSFLDRIKASSKGCALLGNITLFSDLSRHQLHSLYSRLSLRKTEPGEEVISQGEIGTEFYIIRKGEYTAHVMEGGTEATVAEMGEGEYFGEIALLTNGLRTARVRSCAEGELYVLKKEDFEELLGVDAHARNTLKETSSRRLLSEKRILHGGKSSSV